MRAEVETVYIKDVQEVPWDFTGEIFNERFKALIRNDDLVSLTLDHLLSDGQVDLFEYMKINIDDMLKICLINNIEFQEGDSAFKHMVTNQPLSEYSYMINFITKALVATSYEDFKVDISKTDKHIVYINSYRLRLDAHSGAILGLFNPQFIKSNKIKLNSKTILPLLQLLKKYIEENKIEGARYLDMEDAIISREAVEGLPYKYLKMNHLELIEFASEKLRQMEDRPNLQGGLLEVARGRQKFVDSLDLETAKVVTDLMKVLSYEMDNIIDRINLLKMSKKLKLKIYKFELNR